MKHYTSLADIRRDIDNGNLTCRALVDDYLAKAEAGKHINAFLELFPDDARAAADALDAKIKSGAKTGKLAGMVVAIKDNICYKGHHVSASSRILEGFKSIYSSTVVERMLAEDAIIIGRTNCDEFAMGSSNENSAYGHVANPLDTTRVPGGSSGGSVAAVAAGFCLAALGSDTGGSIRQPASFCGVVGMKPTYGTVSRWGIIAYASSFDQVGPIANNTDDAALLLEVISGPDEYDSTLAQKPSDAYSQQLTVNGKMRIAYLEDCLEKEGLDPVIKDRIYSLIAKLRDLGHTVEGVKFPYLDYLVPCYYVLTTAEASSNLARFDGVHYGYRSKNAFDLESTYKKSRSEGFGAEVKRRIMLGTFVLSAGYYDAYYSKGQKVRRLLKDKVDEIFSGYDLILSPTTPGTAFEFGANSADPIKMYLEDIFTVLAPICGLPAISVPAGIHPENGLPFGVQLMAPRFKDGALLAAAKYVHSNA